MKNKNFHWHIQLRQEIDKSNSKFYYFRHTDNDEKYECEEFTFSNGQVSDVKYYDSSKNEFDKLLVNDNVRGTNPITYFGYKNEGWKAFGENLLEE